MNNEPVAWMLADKEAEHIRSIMAVQHDFVPEGCVEIPLYTHLAETITLAELRKTELYRTEQTRSLREFLEPKELTDEEIIEVMNSFVVFDFIGFARAILRKAQKK